jgi:hypothetical protein
MLSLIEVAIIVKKSINSMEKDDYFDPIVNQWVCGIYKISG